MKVKVVLLLVLCAGIGWTVAWAADTGKVSPKEVEPEPVLVSEPAPKAVPELVLADFNRLVTRNNVKGDFGVWHRYPDDPEQSIEIEFDPDDALGDPKGHSLRLTYDVDSPNPAFNGFWMMLRNLDPSPYNALNIYIRGDETKGYPRTVRLEMKDLQGLSGYTVHGISRDWQKFTLPLQWFRKTKEFSRLQQFVVTFDYTVTRPKTGSILIDQITLSSEPFTFPTSPSE